MWIAKVQNVVEKEDGSQELGIVCFIEDERLRTVYEAAMYECRNQKCALAAIYTGMSMDEVDADDATKEGTKAEYQISKGELGTIVVYGKRHRKLCYIRENKRQPEAVTMFTGEELARVAAEEERRHLIECAEDNSKIDMWYMEIMEKYGLWEGEQ